MKRILKRFTSFKNYLAFLRRQPTHIQHVYAFIFAGTITTLIAVFILYFDYGFWHEKYSSTTDEHVASTTVNIESPMDALSRFLQDAKNQLINIDKVGSSLLEGKETYTKDEK